MDTGDYRDIVLADIKRFGFIVGASSLSLFIMGKAYSANLVHFAVTYCTFSILSIIIFRRKMESRYSILLFSLFGFILAYVRASDLVPVFGSYFLGVLLIVALGTVIVLLTVYLDIVLSKKFSRTNICR
ncbi:MAG: hypothetical protein C4287_23045 [Leptolyngbya sp. ERB_1_2]